MQIKNQPKVLFIHAYFFDWGLNSEGCATVVLLWIKVSQLLGVRLEP